MASHDDPEVDMLEIDLAKYPEIQRAIDTRAAVLVQDVKTDPLMSEVRAAVADHEFSSIMVIPIAFGEDILGTLCLKTARSGRAFLNSEINFCTAAARVCANALKNSLLHHQAQKEAKHREASEAHTQAMLHSAADAIITFDEPGRPKIRCSEDGR